VLLKDMSTPRTATLAAHPAKRDTSAAIAPYPECAAQANYPAKVNPTIRDRGNVSSIQGQTLNPMTCRTPGGRVGTARCVRQFAMRALAPTRQLIDHQPGEQHRGIRPTLGLVSRAGITDHSPGCAGRSPHVTSREDVECARRHDLKTATQWSVGNTERTTRIRKSMVYLEAQRHITQFLRTAPVHDEVNRIANQASGLKSLAHVVE